MSSARTVLFTTDELAEYLKVTPRKLEKDRYEGVGIPYVRLSRRCIRYRLADVEQFIASRAVEPDEFERW